MFSGAGKPLEIPGFPGGPGPFSFMPSLPMEQPQPRADPGQNSRADPGTDSPGLIPGLIPAEILGLIPDSIPALEFPGISRRGLIPGTSPERSQADPRTTNPGTNPGLSDDSGIPSIPGFLAFPDSRLSRSWPAGWPRSGGRRWLRSRIPHPSSAARPAAPSPRRGARPPFPWISGAAGAAR